VRRAACLLDVEPRQSGREGFTKPVRRAGAGHRVADLVRPPSGLPTVPARSALRRPHGPIASARLAVTQAHHIAGTAVLLGMFRQPCWQRGISCGAAIRVCPAHTRIAIGPGMQRGGVVLVWKICLARVNACGDTSHIFVCREIVERTISCWAMRDRRSRDLLFATNAKALACRSRTLFIGAPVGANE